MRKRIGAKFGMFFKYLTIDNATFLESTLLKEAQSPSHLIQGLYSTELLHAYFVALT